ncbi:hypothetical protein VN97_g7443 [Penicillium thymicola]|uniref:Uncharacterized protein n=1 Tax=Penicillium thymicola TaxID=293382 RepID=A0AAI9TFN2_PENTH|nr:hypothetical protein VN97_g7443 [Penicillium thymicola]
MTRGGESRGSRGKPSCGFSAGLWLPLAPPLHQSASTADSRSCNDLPLRPFCLPFFFLASYTFKYSQLPSHSRDIIVHHLRNRLVLNFITGRVLLRSRFV